MSGQFVGYIVAGNEHGFLVADWDGVVHPTEQAGRAALTECRQRGWPDWQLYAVLPLPDVQS